MTYTRIAYIIHIYIHIYHTQLSNPIFRNITFKSITVWKQSALLLLFYIQISCGGWCFKNEDNLYMNSNNIAAMAP